MANSLKKRGQKFIRRFSRASEKAAEEGKEHIKENFLQRLSHIRNIRLLVLEWVLLAFALIMLSVAQAFWFADSYANDAFINGGSYIEATVGRVSSMNPLFATTSSERALSRLMFATLTSVDYSGHPGLGLADYIYGSEDGKVWTVRLREGLKWSDGEPLTNKDVLFTVSLIQNPATNTIYSANLENVKVSENANGEIVFTLPAAYADFVSALEIPIVPEHELADADAKVLVEDEFSLAPVTSGAFTFNATQTATASDEEVIYLSANPYYYMGKPKLNSFAVHAYEDKSDVVAAVNAGAVTATAELSGLEADKVTNGNFYRRETGIDAGVFMFMNVSNGTLRNVELRRAIQQGVDVAAARASAPGTGEIYYPILGSQIALNSYPGLPSYNFAEAAATVARVRGDGELSINLATVNAGYLPAVAENVRAQLSELGFTVNLSVYEESQDFVTNVLSRRSYDILIYEIEMGADPDPLPYYHSSQASTAGLNLSNYRNTLVDDLLIGARETLDTTLRVRKYESFLEYWVNEAPAVGLYRANLTYIYNKNVLPYSETAQLATALDRFGDVENWAANRGTRNLTP